MLLKHPVPFTERTSLIAYHPETAELALFNSEDKYWVGSWSPHLTHQNGEPPYYLIMGYFDDINEALLRLNQLPKDAF